MIKNTFEFFSYLSVQMYEKASKNSQHVIRYRILEVQTIDLSLSHAGYALKQNKGFFDKLIFSVLAKSQNL